MAASSKPAKPASSASLTNMTTVMSAVGVVTAASAIYAGHSLVSRGDLQTLALRFLTGPGRTSRILLSLFVATNLKNMPFVWTLRLFGAMLRHTYWPRKPLPQTSLFHYSITHSYTPLMETDYNMHKSNSTYFSDLDTSRTHLVMFLLGPAVAAAGRNQETKLVCSPDDPSKAMPGNFGVGLGGVYCSFRKEIAPYQGYEMWSRVLCWDRKWLYTVTHFVVKGKVKPPSLDSSPQSSSAGSNKKAQAWTPEDEANLQKYVIATAVSRYVFKMGRFTVHPAILVEASGLLPARPGPMGWRGGADAVGDLSQAVDADAEANTDADTETGEQGAWTWKDVERERRRGMVIADRFAGLEDAGLLFDGGKNGALGIFGPG
ncbi:capsule polysaccharide biosynthesis protein [Ophiostoma piceae UAMH 11346]|uniref:Capsule polysaccharide biosynthesis protein n=1 Tax=Ophiostoma piceae (strain UAMH 11346) TaxID=1262450 RepID=S3BQT2_OPHP1|nr:capsule polysaccharide biosynthesis protein [Ophiostoma piceae UAMH 11346]